MADVKFEVTRFALSTATAGNTQDITISGFGTPKAAIFILSGGVTDDTARDYVYSSVGFTDGTNQAATGVISGAPLAVANTARGATNTAVIAIPSTDGSSFNALFSVNSFITDGIRLDIDNAIGAAFLTTCILIGGDDVGSVHVGTKDDLGTGTSAVVIDTVGFEPDLVFMSTVGHTVQTDAAVHNVFSFGVGHNNGSDTQRVAAIGGVDAVDPTVNTGYIGNDSIVGQVHNAALTWDGVIGSYDANGFSITPNASSAQDIIYYLCLKFSNGPDIAVFDTSIPTTGDYAETTLGFTPTFGMVTSMVGPTARNTAATTGCYSLAISAFDANSVITAIATDENGAATSNATSMSSDQFRIRKEDNSGDEALASGYAFDTDGWDFTLSTNPATNPVLGWGLAVGPGSNPGARFEVVDFTLPISGTTFDISAPSGFGTPTAAIFIWAGSPVALDTVTSHAYTSVGFTDGTREYCAGTSAWDGQNETDEARFQRDDCVIAYVSPADLSYPSTRFSFNKWLSVGVDGSDGVQLSIDSAAPSARKGMVIFVGGDDVANVYVDDFSLGTGTSAIDVTAPTFEPDLLFIASSMGGSTIPAQSQFGKLSFGVAVNDGSDTQRVAGYSTSDAQTSATITGAFLGNTSAAARAQLDTASTGSFTYTVAVSDFDANGFSVTPSAAATSQHIGYVAIKFATGTTEVSLFDMAWPTSGNYAETTPGFEPTFGLITSSTAVTTRNTMQSVSIGHSVAAFDAANAFTTSITNKDNASLAGTPYSVVKGYASQAIKILDDDGSTIAVQASGYAFDADGWDITLTTNPASTVLGWGLAIGPSVATAEITFSGPNVPNMTGTEGEVFVSETIATRFSGTYTPFSYALAPTSSALPDGLTINATTGEVTGTPSGTSEGAYTGIIIRGTDAGA